MLYFLPKFTGLVNLEVGRRHALGYAFESESFACNDTAAGPDGGPGTTFAVGGDGVVVTYPPDQVTWQKHETADYWVGLERPHTPGDLAREEMLPGHWVRLADGQDWLVPVARGAGEEDGKPVWYEHLPRRLARKDGDWVAGEVIKRYEPLWSIGKAFAEMDDQMDVFDAAITALSFNYRVGTTEALLLGLIDISGPVSHAASRILEAVIDGPRREELQKKRALTSTTSDGEPDSGEDTGQA